MSKREEHRFNLQDYKASKADEGAVFIDAGGRTFRVPPPLLWGDDVTEAARTGQAVAFGESLLGAEDFAAFRAAGGTGTLLMSMVNEVHGTGVGESSASSDS